MRKLSFSFLSGIFLLYAKMEENYGLARHAMAVYERATEGVLPEEQNEVRFEKLKLKLILREFSVCVFSKKIIIIVASYMAFKSITR